jgi:hypothetical protein
MLKNIRLHIEQDEEKQKALETKLAQHINVTQKENINAFQRSIPSLLSYIKKAKSQNISIFCNKFCRFNIVDYGLGRVFYGFEPEQEISSQVAAFKAHSLYVSTDSESAKTLPEPRSETPNLPNLAAYKRHLETSPFSKDCDLLVVLGIGLGQHLKLLLESSTIKHLIIYEPELQYFSCSVMVTPWREILEIAKQKGTAIYLQLEKDGRDLINDVMELRESFAVKGFYIYQHYHHPVFNSLYKAFGQNTWSTLLDKGISFKMHDGSDDYCPLWTPPADLNSYKEVDKAAQRFIDNLTAFKRYFPKIHAEFEHYQPKNWLPIYGETGQINLINMDNLTTWYSDQPVEDCIFNFDNYSQQPNKDGLVLGYSGQKLKHYIHYQFVKETEELLKDIEEEQGVLPSTIKSLIMFGLGVGYQVEHLVSKHKVEKLFICEPNRDFFYASLFSIDWAKILKEIDKNEGRLYINIGDDGTNLFRDLLNQFYSIGPYVLSQTYFYQSYYNAALTHSISQLREQLQVVIAMGEYFDHARFGIAHTKEALLREYPHMRKDAAACLTFDEKEVPVMFVGNGPSLDYSINAIKQWKDKAIIISCGTALQVLHRNGIVPDFHAEIEQNRSTFDWAARIEDFDYLKSITLISCNGVHPDTCNLYKDVLIAFKEGESSTVSTLHVLGESRYETLKYAFPTVTNFALNFFIKLGFKQHYLIGVDLGFVDITKHHSVQSGYYSTEGSQLYDYAEKNSGSLIVPGNFRKTVNTKQEFKIAKMVMEQSLSAANVECYNTSDGAKIVGSLALSLDDILLTSNINDKHICLENLKQRCFTIKSKSSFVEDYQETFSTEILLKEFSMFKKRLEQPVETIEQAELLVESQKRMLFASYQHGQSTLFYLTYGTVNYANVVLTKIAYSTLEFDSQLFEKARLLWLKYFDLIFHESQFSSHNFDTSSSFLVSSIFSFLKVSLDSKKILIVTNSPNVFRAAPDLLKDFSLSFDITFMSVNNFYQSGFEDFAEFEFLIFYQTSFEKETYEKFEIKYQDLKLQKLSILILVDEFLTPDFFVNKPNNICFYICPGDMLDDEAPLQCNDYSRVIFSLFMLSDLGQFSFFYSKYSVFGDYRFLDKFNFDALKDCNFVDLGFAIGVGLASRLAVDDILNNGCRGIFLENGIKRDSLIKEYIDTNISNAKKLNFLNKHPYLKEDSHYV